MSKTFKKLFKIGKVIATILFFISLLSYIACFALATYVSLHPELTNATKGTGAMLMLCCVLSFFYDKYYIIAFIVYRVYKWFRPLSDI